MTASAPVHHLPDHPLLAAHAVLLDEARAALAGRSWFSRYPESPSPRVFGEAAAADGLAASTSTGP